MFEDKKTRTHPAIAPSVSFFKLDAPQAPEHAPEAKPERRPGSLQPMLASENGNSNNYGPSREDVERRLLEQAQETHVQKMQAFLAGAGSMETLAAFPEVSAVKLASDAEKLRIGGNRKKPF